ncbi:hypothetical protein T08_1239 [Trichinella sp. T8]|nr:hypothetical protein T08_15111 [Trichinella sp. T8]KRZ97659.1 hypothetical protein T08_1239 [Trichinella sp. T8]
MEFQSVNVGFYPKLRRNVPIFPRLEPCFPTISNCSVQRTTPPRKQPEQTRNRLSNKHAHQYQCALQTNETVVLSSFNKNQAQKSGKNKYYALDDPFVACAMRNLPHACNNKKIDLALNKILKNKCKKFIH